MARKKLTRKTAGLNAQVFVAKAIDITTDATLALFLANAPLGEIGVYDGNNALHTNAITSAEEFYFVLRTTEGIKTSPRYKLADCTITKKTYVAPVKQVAAIGWTGTTGSFNNDTIVVGNLFSFKVIETTEGNDPFPTWYYEYQTVSGDTAMDVAQALAKKVNDADSVEHKQNQRFVNAVVKADATYGNFAMTGTTPTLIVTNGSTTVNVEGADGTFDGAVGDLISFHPSSTPTDAIGDIYEIVGVTSGADGEFELNRPYTGATQTFTEAEGEGTRVKKVTSVVNVGVVLTTIDDNVHFRLAVQEELVNATITYVTAFTQGNGTYEQVLSLEKEGNTFAGETTQNAAFKDKYGVQDIFSVSGETYDYYTFDIIKSEKGIAPVAQAQARSYIIIAVAKSAGNVDGTLDTLFGVS